MVTTDLIDEVLATSEIKKLQFRELLASKSSNFPWDPAADGIPTGVIHPYHFKNYNGKDLRNWRLKSGFYVTHCAKIANISSSSWRAYEKGHRPLPAHFFIILFYIETLKSYFFVQKR